MHTTNDNRLLVGFHLPLRVVAEIDKLAEAELTTRAAWLRRVALQALRDQGGNPQQKRRQPQAEIA